MNLHMSTELADEVVAEALRHINRKSVEYHLHVQNSDEYLLAQIDAKLIVQVLINIIDNAIKYTTPGSDITIEWNRKGDFIYISVADNGPGIPDQAKPHVFEMFYTVSNEIVDSRRSMGLGLAPVQIHRQCAWRRNQRDRSSAPWICLYIFCTSRGG